jgi:hypothetical protein
MTKKEKSKYLTKTILTIKKFSENDSGIYICKAKKNSVFKHDVEQFVTVLNVKTSGDFSTFSMIRTVLGDTDRTSSYTSEFETYSKLKNYYSN